MEQEPKGQEKSAEFNPAELESKEASKGPEVSRESEAKRSEDVEAAREQLEQRASSEQREPQAEPVQKRSTSGLDRKQAYAETMASIQRHLPTASRAFSKVIHSPAVEKTSEAVGKTVMRPSVTLGATTTALAVGAFTYWLAKHYGYAVSGSTILLSLLVGGAFGLLVEGLAKLLRRKP